MAVNGIDLIVPSSINFSGTSASINAGGSVTFSAVTALSLNGVFSSTYDNYVIDMRGGLASGIQGIQFRLRLAGTDASGSNYVYQFMFTSGASVSASRLSTTFVLAGAFGAVPNGDQVHVYGPALAQPTALRHVNVRSDSGAAFSDHAGTHSLATAYDGFTLTPASSNITGLIKVYGLVK